jgi:hypothetical protein
MARVYARCRTYRDTGCVRTEFRDRRGRPGFASIRPFATAFARPDRFRFEFSDHFPNQTAMHRYIVHLAGRAVRTWWDLRPGVERSSSLGLALAGATGVSGGAAHTVPALLLPRRVGGRRLTGLADVARLEDGDAGGAGCYRVRGQLLLPPEAEAEMRREVKRVTGRDPGRTEVAPAVVWIDRRTLLVRRIEEADRFRTGGTVEVTEYEPAVNVRVAAAALRFDPPPGGAAEPRSAPDTSRESC